MRLPFGVNPYFRWGTSYREPGITECYLLRDFGDPAFSVLVIPNTALKPERGRGYEAGVKVQRARLLASAGYFRNRLGDFIGNAFADPVFVPADPARGLGAVSPFFPFHGVLYVQRANTARAHRGRRGGLRSGPSARRARRHEPPSARWAGSRVRILRPTGRRSRSSTNSITATTRRFRSAAPPGTPRGEDRRASFTLGVENLTDRLYFEHFQTAPAPGRAVVFGLTLDFFGLLRK